MRRENFAMTELAALVILVLVSWSGPGRTGQSDGKRAADAPAGASTAGDESSVTEGDTEMSNGLDRGFGWEMVRLDLDVTPDPEKGRILVQGTARLRLAGDSSSGPALTLNTRSPLLHFLRLESEGAEALPQAPVQAPSSEGAKDTASVSARLRFPAPLARGTEITVRFACEGRAAGSQLVAQPDIALASWVEGWYPSPLQADGEEGAPAAPGTTRIFLPDGWRSVSNGRLLGDEPVADEPEPGWPAAHCETWEVVQPMARSFAAGPYEVARVQAGALEVGVFLLSPKPTGAAEQAEILARALSAMETRFGPYPYPTYAIAELPEESVRWSASSEQGFILAKSSILAFPGGNLPLFAHEAAHGWWGNLVRTRPPGETFCSESLAEYGAVLAIEALEGPDAAVEFLEYSREGYNPLQSALGYFYMWRDGGDKPLADLADDKWDHNLADSKGAWVLHMLRRETGDEAFFAALRGVLERHAGGAISLDDLETAFVEASGPKARDFFRQWLRGRGAPVFHLDWWSADRGKSVEIHLRQVQKEEPFRLAIDVAVDLPGGETALHRLEITQREESFTLPVTARPVGVRLDPDHAFLIWRPQYGPRPPGAEVR